MRTNSSIGKISIAAAILITFALTSCGADNTTSTDKPRDSKVAVDDNARKALPATIKDRGNVSIAYTGAVTPIEFTNEDTKPDGLAVNLLQEASARLGIDVKFEQTSFDSFIPGLLSKRYDMISSQGDFKERTAKVDMIDYLWAGTALITSPENPKNIHGPEDLCGTKVAYAIGTAQQGLVQKLTRECQKKGAPALDSSPQKGAREIELAVRSGQADAGWDDVAPAAYLVKNHPDQYAIAHTDMVAPYGISFRKDEPELLEAYHLALKGMVKDGSFDKIMEKWGMEKYAMPKLPINSGPSLSSLS